MSIGTLIAEGDWAGRPATKGDLVLVQTHLEGKMKDLRVEMSNVDTSLRSEIAKLRVSMVWMTVAVATGLGGLITVFEFLS